MKRITRKIWFRKSTNDWVWEWTINIPEELHATYRYSGKYKIVCFVNYLIYCSSMYKDLINAKNKLNGNK